MHKTTKKLAWLVSHGEADKMAKYTNNPKDGIKRMNKITTKPKEYKIGDK